MSGIRFMMIVLMLGALCCGSATAAAVLRVDAQATGDPSDGQSWETAFRTLYDALAVAASGDEIWMAGGTYAPQAINKGAETFFLIPGVSIYGGFTSGASIRGDRDPKNVKTILSGDLNQDDGEGLFDENSRHVVTFLAEGGPAALLDGLVITAGNASMDPPPEESDEEISGGGISVTGGTLNLNNCTIENNQAMAAGAGMLCRFATVNATNCTFRSNLCAVAGAIQVSDSSVVTLSRCLIALNEASWGGAIRVAAEGARLVAENCIFADNTAYGEGGAVYNIGAAAELRFCTLSGNNAYGEGGGAIGHVVDAQTTLVSSILSGNSPNEIFEYEGGTLQVTNSIVAGGWAEGGNLDVDPRFRLVKDPPYQPNWDSPAINAAQSPAPADDFLGTSRPQNDAPDIGAYEFGKDTDSGGLPDAYETQYVLTVSDPSDDSIDSDEDGLDNREEYRRGSNPRDETDPRSEYYVAPSGDDSMNDGSAELPWQTIGYAMGAVPEGASTFPITIHLAPGVYEEAVVFRPYVRLVGSSVDDTRIQYFQQSDDAHVVIMAAQGAALSHCTVTFPEPVTATAELLRIPEVAMTVSDVVFNGVDSPHAIGIFVSGVGSSASVIRDSVVKRCEYGVYAVNSGVNITRNWFEDILAAGVFIRPPEGSKEESVTPVLGVEEDLSSTGFNRFRMSSGDFIINTSASSAEAQYNDWGVYTAEEIAARVSGSGGVDYAPYLEKALVLGSVAAALLDADGKSIPLTANPSVSVSAQSGAPNSGNICVFSGLMPGTYTLTGSADGYDPDSRMVTLTGAEVATVDLRLKYVGGGGEKPRGGCFAVAAGKASFGPWSGQASGDALLLLMASGLLWLHGKARGSGFSRSTASR